jgi:nucleoid DNA-binding protein
MCVEEQMMELARQLNCTKDDVQRFLHDIGAAIKATIDTGSAARVPGLKDFYPVRQACNGCDSYYSSGGPVIEPVQDISARVRDVWQCSETECKKRVRALSAMIKRVLDLQGSITLDGFGVIRKTETTTIDYEPEEG